MKLEDKVKSLLSKFYGILPKWLTAHPWRMETAGTLLFTIPLLKVFSLVVSIPWIQAGLSWAVFQWLSVEYEERFDPNGWQEGKDVVMRLLISTVFLGLYAYFAGLAK